MTALRSALANTPANMRLLSFMMSKAFVMHRVAAKPALIPLAGRAHVADDGLEGHVRKTVPDGVSVLGRLGKRNEDRYVREQHLGRNHLQPLVIRGLLCNHDKRQRAQNSARVKRVVAFAFSPKAAPKIQSWFARMAMHEAITTFNQLSAKKPQFVLLGLTFQ